MLPLHAQPAGAGSTSLVMWPVAHTLADLAHLLDRRDAADEHLAEAVAVARAWAAPHWEADARAAIGPAPGPGLAGQARNR